MKSVLISIQPCWCDMIASGKKTVEVRKTKPKLETPFKCYIYCTLPPKEELFTHGGIREYARELIRLQDGRIVNDYGMRLCCDIENRPYSKDNFLCKKVIGEFVCDEIHPIIVHPNGAVQNWNWYELSKSCLTLDKVAEYIGSNKTGYGWHISDLVIYSKPKSLSEFIVERYPCLARLKRPPQSWCYVEELKDA